MLFTLHLWCKSKYEDNEYETFLGSRFLTHLSLGFLPCSSGFEAVYSQDLILNI